MNDWVIYEQRLLRGCLIENLKAIFKLVFHLHAKARRGLRH